MEDVREALVESANSWDFILEEVDGVVVTTEISVPVTLCVSKRGSGVNGGEICGNWHREVSEQLGRPTPVESGIRLAQPQWRSSSAEPAA